MAKVRLTKEFSFEMAHALDGYDGACKHIHGHSYRLFVTIIGEPNDDESNPKYGMVMDFKVLKGIVNRFVIDKYDHAFVCKTGESSLSVIDSISEFYGNVVMVDYQPTCENMISRIADDIKSALPDNVKLHHVKMHETATSYAEWYSSDNE